MSAYRFENRDAHLEENEASKSGFKDIWVGIANATDEAVFVETHVECAIPMETSGIAVEVGGGEIPEVCGLPFFMFSKKSKQLVEKDTVGPKRPEKLPKHTYKKFYINSDKTNESELIRLTISKVEDMTNGWNTDQKKKHGVIIAEIDGEIEVVAANGQFWPANRWKSHRNCRNSKYPETFDPKEN